MLVSNDDQVMTDAQRSESLCFLQWSYWVFYCTMLPRPMVLSQIQCHHMKRFYTALYRWDTLRKFPSRRFNFSNPNLNIQWQHLLCWVPRTTARQLLPIARLPRVGPTIGSHWTIGPMTIRPVHELHCCSMVWPQMLFQCMSFMTLPRLCSNLGLRQNVSSLPLPSPDIHPSIHQLSLDNLIKPY